MNVSNHPSSPEPLDNEAAAHLPQSPTPSSDHSGTAPAAPNPAATDRRPIIAICSLIALLVYLAFGYSRHYSFLNWDDIIYIRDYPQVNEGLSWKNFFWAWTHPHYSNWHPLTTLSFMLDVTLFKTNGAGFHIHNILLHALASILCFLALHKLTGSRWRSAFAAAIFAIHPLRVESVAWITERKDVLSGLFLMATLLAYAGYAQKQSKARFLAVCFFFLCGLLSKSVLVTVPALLLILDFWPLRRIDPASLSPFSLPKIAAQLLPLLREKIPLILLAAGSCVATLLSADSHRPLDPPLLIERLQYIPVWWVAYIRLFFFPFDLAAHYPYTQSGPLPSIWMGCLLLSIVITCFCWVKRNSAPFLIAAWLWFLIALLPVIGIVPPGIQIMADRYTYVSQIGFGVALSWGVFQFASRWQKRWVAPALLLAFTGFLVSQSDKQTRFWGDDLSLWSRTLEVTRQNDFAIGQYGDSLAVSNRLDEAEPHYREALKLNPRLTGVLNNLSVIRRSKGDLKEAEEFLRRAQDVSPWFVSARIDLAQLVLSKGQQDEAIAILQDVIRIEPKNFDALYRMGLIFSEGDPQKKNLPEALQAFRKALELQPNSAQLHFSMGNCHYLSGNTSEAMDHYAKAVAIDPKMAKAANNLGTLLARAGKLQESIQAYSQAINSDPDYIEPYDGIAETFLRIDSPENATRAWKAASEKNPKEARFYYKLAWVLATTTKDSLRNGPAAEQYALEAVKLTNGSEPMVWDALAAACAEQGRFTEALRHANQGVAVSEKIQNQQIANQIRMRLAFYEQQKPFRVDKF